MMLDKIIYPEKAFYYFKQRYHAISEMCDVCADTDMSKETASPFCNQVNPLNVL